MDPQKPREYFSSPNEDREFASIEPTDLFEQPESLLDQEGPSDEEIRLQALNHTKDRLLSIMSHDLRSAIGGVLSIVRMLDKRLEIGDLPEAKRLSGLIRRASMDADELLTDLVEWTRSYGDKMDFRMESMDIMELIDIEVSRLKSAAMHKKQRVRVEPYDTGMIRADRYMLQAIFRNLLSNALKFSHKGGVVTVRIYRQPGLWEFQICDKGVGMGDEVQKRLMKLDSRKQKSGTAGEVGSGFGLLLCEDFVQRHGGHLTWESVEGQGTTFYFTIPELIG